jgi:hypothetical protein
MRRLSEPHNAPSEVAEWVAAAARLVDDLGVPDDLRVAAFTGALGLLSAKQLFFEQPTFSPLAMPIPRGG